MWPALEQGLMLTSVWKNYILQRKRRNLPSLKFSHDHKSSLTTNKGIQFIYCACHRGSWSSATLAVNYYVEERFFPMLYRYQYCRVTENSASYRQLCNKLSRKKGRNFFFLSAIMAIALSALRYKQNSEGRTALLSLSSSRVANPSNFWCFGRLFKMQTVWC